MRYLNITLKYLMYYMHTHFFILTTELTKLNLKTNKRWDPYLNFDYLELVLPSSFTELLSQAYRRTLIASHLAAHIYQILNISCECNCFCPEIQCKMETVQLYDFLFHQQVYWNILLLWFCLSSKLAKYHNW